jgi:hypothetical protein
MELKIENIDSLSPEEAKVVLKLLVKEKQPNLFKYEELKQSNHIPNFSGTEHKNSQWTKTETTLFLQNIDEPLYLLQQLFPGRSRNALYAKRSKLKKKYDKLHGRKSHSKQTWTQKELTVLHNVHKLPLDNIMKFFPHRNEASVTGKMYQLGYSIQRTPSTNNIAKYLSTPKFERQLKKQPKRKSNQGESKYNQFVGKQIKKYKKADPNIKAQDAFKLAVKDWKNYGKKMP